MEFPDQEVTVHNESTKRNLPDATDTALKNTSKKRRSSLAATRRSITGDIVSHETCLSTMSSSQETTLNGPSVQRLKPNAANIRMDAVVSKFHNKIKALDQEYDQWKEALRVWDDKVENSRLLKESSAPMMASELLDEIKALVQQNKYITCQTTDFVGLEKTVEQLLLKIYINMNCCMKDLHLVRKIVQGIQCSSQITKNQLSVNMASDSTSESTDSVERGDVKSLIENWINSE